MSIAAALLIVSASYLISSKVIQVYTSDSAKVVRFVDVTHKESVFLLQPRVHRCKSRRLMYARDASVTAYISATKQCPFKYVDIFHLMLVIGFCIYHLPGCK